VTLSGLAVWFIAIDVTKEPPLRTLSLSGSDYAIETDTFIGALHHPEVAYQHERGLPTTKLKIVNILQADTIQLYFADLVNHEYTL
jgi:hypothetical protein